MITIKESHDVDPFFKNISKDLTTLFNNNKLYPDVYNEGTKILIYVDSGDWKHEHGVIKNLIHKYFGKNEMDYKLDVKADDDSEDDTYSSLYIITIDPIDYDEPETKALKDAINAIIDNFDDVDSAESYIMMVFNDIISNS